MGKLVQILVAARLWIFPIPLSAVVLGGCLAYRDTDAVQVSVFLLQLVCLTAAFALTNLLNTYYDFVNDVDGPESDDRTLVDKLLTPDEVLRASGVALIVSIASFTLILLFAHAPTLHILPLYIVGVSAGVLYTAGARLKYYAAGDATVFIAGGMVSVLFAYLGQGGLVSSSPAVLLYSLPLGLNVTCALHCNNVRDAETDNRKGLLTVAILLGNRGSYVYFLVLVFGSFLLFIGMTIVRSFWFLLPLLSVWSAIDCERRYASGSFDSLVQKVAHMNLLQMVLYAAAWFLH